ncbi:HAMP domain-containing sensor histidine kinase [Ferrovibrio sp.]|uniref:sensor histidine kinase n=1 Tax=Ferrovibrio sp. TaxID=1917215 RepID=UPI0025BD93DE|nr:HAMP domain-containing sensor histidine kinase [Ferrovibrio sp.]MBX3452906.1 HAMP domain-containing histidine kinase [Ferrovibrio sp.]
MLDIGTSVLMITLTLLLQGCVFLVVWLTQRQLPIIKYFAAGFLCYGIAMLLLIFRGLFSGFVNLNIIAHNVIITAASALVVYGLGRLLNQSGFPRILIACVAFTAVFWPITMLIDPDNVGLRVLASNALGIIISIAIFVILLRDISQPRLIRWIGLAVITIQFCALVLRSAITIQLMYGRGGSNEAILQGWYYFFFHFVMSCMFLVVLGMVGYRLQADLHARNNALSLEVEERKQLQEMASKALEAEKSARKEQRQLLRMVTHEFRTPLSIIDRSAEMIDVVTEKSLPAVTQRVETIHGAVQRLVRFTERFLATDRHEKGVVQPEEVMQPDLIARVREHFDGLDDAARLHFSLAPDFPHYYGDLQMLATALINLIDNALKYSPENAAIDVTVSWQADEIVLSVRDRGIGIPEEEASSIGSRFFRASNTAAATGTGLGLYNTRRLLDFHNGRLALRPAPGGGTIATIYLPLPGIPLHNPTVSA